MSARCHSRIINTYCSTFIDAANTIPTVHGDFPQVRAVLLTAAIASVNSTWLSSFSTSGKRDRRNYRFTAVTRFLTDRHVAFIRSFLAERDDKREKTGIGDDGRDLCQPSEDRMLNFPRR